MHRIQPRAQWERGCGAGGRRRGRVDLSEQPRPGFSVLIEAPSSTKTTPHIPSPPLQQEGDGWGRCPQRWHLLEVVTWLSPQKWRWHRGHAGVRRGTSPGEGAKTGTWGLLAPSVWG